VLALLLVAVSVGLDNFGATTAIGVSGVDRDLRLRIAVIFGVFEAVMPVIGLLLGHGLAHELGAAAKPSAGAMLGVAGAYVIGSEIFGKQQEQGAAKGPGISRLIVIAAALSIDNLVVGFALGAYRVNLAVAVVTIAATSVVLSLLGLEIGRHLGERIGRGSELLGGLALVLVGIAIGTGLL
jgi:putative Mn2+ efflux pump MntP